MAINEDNAWKLLPHTLAPRATGGLWKPYPYLVYASRLITEQICKGDARIIVTMPPRHGKSKLISQWVPVWFLENFDQKSVILVSYGAEYAGEWGGRVRDTFESSEFLTQKVKHDKRGTDKFEFESGSVMYTAGMGGALTGRGGDLIIIDDPVKNFEEAVSETKREKNKRWFDSTLYTRAEPGCSFILLMTRWHEDDLAGYLINEHDDKWIVVNMEALYTGESPDPIGRKKGQALCPDRYSANRLKKIKGTTVASQKIFESLYQGAPTMQEGDMLKRSFFKFYDKPPNVVDEMIMSWDMSFKDKKQSKSGDPDYVVGQVWGRVKQEIFLLAQYRGQWGLPKTITMFKRAVADYPKAWVKLIEDKANGPAVQAMLKKQIRGIKMVEPQGDKIGRASMFQVALESNIINVPSPKIAPWVTKYLNECASFPRGKNDDQVDASSQAIIYLDRSSRAKLRDLAQK